jgi:hypothetical protein
MPLVFKVVVVGFASLPIFNVEPVVVTVPAV